MNVLWVLGMAGLILAAAWFNTTNYVRRAEKFFPPQGRYVEVNGIKLHYIDRGSGEPVVFIHGSFGSSYYFLYSSADAVSKDRRFIAFDLPGYGYSQRPHKEMTLEDHADYLHNALSKLGIKKFILAAHSMGGSIAMAYTLKYPGDLKALILLGGYVTPFEGPLDRMYTLPAVPLAGEFFLRFFLVPLSQKKAAHRAVDAFRPDPVHELYAQTASALALRPENYRANAEDVRNLRASLQKMQARYSSIKIPVTIISGDQDRVAPHERHALRLHQVLPDSQLIMLSGAGHMIPFSGLETLLQAIETADKQTLQEADV